MGDLIDRSRLKEELRSWAINIINPKYYLVEDADFVIDTQAVVDIIHCKECGYWWKTVGLCTHPKCCSGTVAVVEAPPEHFCSYGERKEK